MWALREECWFTVHLQFDIHAPLCTIGHHEMKGDFMDSFKVKVKPK